MTFAQLEARANQGAHLLHAAGLKTGDHIVILMENRREFLEVCFAADRAGLFYTTASTHLTRDEIAYVVADCNAGMVITSDSFTQAAAALQSDLSDTLRLLMVGAPAPGCESWEARADLHPTSPIADEMQGLDMLYSSGTTGRPKGIKWPMTGEKPGTSTMLIELLTSLFGYDHNSRYLCPAPLYHAAPLRHAIRAHRAAQHRRLEFKAGH